MKKIHILVSALLLTGLCLVTPAKADARICDIPDPIQGDISITCRDSRMDVSGDGVRYLPHPSTLPVGTRIGIEWIQPFSGNTLVASWDFENQTSYIWQQIGGVWTHNPENAFIQEIGESPRIVLVVMTMPNGTRGWAVTRMRDLMIWNGGN